MEIRPDGSRPVSSGARERVSQGRLIRLCPERSGRYVSRITGQAAGTRERGVRMKFGRCEIDGQPAWSIIDTDAGKVWPFKVSPAEWMAAYFRGEALPDLADRGTGRAIAEA